MGWDHVEDSEGTTDTPEFSAERKDGFTGTAYRAKSTSTFGFSVWRCSGCGALAATKQGTPMSGECGVCHT